MSFLVLAAYVAFDAVKSLIMREPPEGSYVGIALAALSLVVMPLLARAKRRVAATKPGVEGLVEAVRSVLDDGQEEVERGK